MIRECDLRAIGVFSTPSSTAISRLSIALRCTSSEQLGQRATKNKSMLSYRIKVHATAR